ncbi:hypothetical protein NC652_006880 [Populus alba x Populus x berolinensis]|nr:hypothetical protein NC652_006880 [Populus alba x Populus x berolinensis]
MASRPETLEYPRRHKVFRCTLWAVILSCPSQETEESVAITLRLSTHAKLRLPSSNSSKSDVCKKDSHNPHKLFTETIRHLSSASLSLTLLTLPFFYRNKGNPIIKNVLGPCMQNEINELKKQVKPTPVTPEGTPVESAPSPVELKIQQLTEAGPQA